MSVPPRTVNAETVRHLAEYAGLPPLPDDRIELHLGFLRQQLEEMERWKTLRLGFSFEGGRFTFVRPAVLDRIPWEYPVPLTRNRGASKGSG